MEIKSTFVVFKSTPENYEKERRQKNCTVRKLSEEEETLLKRYRIKWIGIRNEETGETRIRPIADITKWDDYYIFTWVPYEKPQAVEYHGLELTDIPRA